MKTLLLAFVLGMFGLVASAQEKIEDVIKSLEQRRFSAQTNKDEKTLNEIYADDVIYTHSSGLREGKADYIKNTVSGKWNYQDLTLEELNVQPFGTTAIGTGRVKIGANVIMYTVVYLKRKGKWQLVNWTSTKLPPPQN
jgi:ketosteroid isomerase-like protein